MKRITTATWACVQLLTAVAFAQQTSLDLGSVRDRAVLDASGVPIAQLEGGARVSPGGPDGGQALDLGGEARKGVLSFGTTFASEKQGTLEFHCKPRVLSGIIVGKYGAINIEFVKGQNTVRFGLKLEREKWIHCMAPKNSATRSQWLHIKASWGNEGMLLFLDGKLAAHAALPEPFEWFISDRAFLLGSYDWPGGYPVWFFDGLIGNFSYRSFQESFNGALPKPVPAPDILTLRLRDSPKPNYGVPVPATVHGRVVLDANANLVPDAEESGVADVSISDGYSVVKTNKQGRYSLRPSPKAVFIFITRPSNHDVIGDWYKPLTSGVDFLLRRAERSEDEYTFVLVTDTHVSANPRSLAGLSQFVKEVNALNPPPRFVFNSGDLVSLDKQLNASASTGHGFFRNYTGIMNHLRMPCYNVAGDHTDSGYRLDEFRLGDHRAGKPMYWEYLGPNLFSFEYGRLHFVSVDVVYHLSKKTSHTMIPHHQNWFVQDLESRGAGTIVLTASENPLDRSIPGFVELARRCDIKLQLVGDTHVVSYRKSPVPSRAHGALAGTWWNGPCADLHPQGYMIYQVRGTELDCFYKGLDKRVAIVSPAYGAGVMGRLTVSADLLQPQSGETLQYSIDSGEWQTMEEVSHPFYRARFEAAWDSSSARDGLAEVKVRCMPGGETRSHIAVIDNRKSKAPGSDGAVTFTAGRVIGAAYSLSGKVSVLVNGEPVGALRPGQRGKCSFSVPEQTMRKVNTLAFEFANPHDRISISSPVLHVGGETIKDPRAVAVREVRANHWPEKTVERAGFVLGDDPPESSFALRQDTFRFVLP